MWYDETVVYQIYPLGFCGALGGKGQYSISHILDFSTHLKKLGIVTLLLNPLFSSDYHGYDTKDYLKVDERLGSNEELQKVCASLHRDGFRILFDGVFNHVGRGFWAFQDVLQKREQSKYLHWFYINLDGDNGYGDHLWYEGWEGHFELVKLNLQNPEVVEYLLSCVDKWIEDYDIDGLRLDVAYCLDREFLKRLRQHTTQKKTDFFLLGETLHGDYNQWMNDEMCHSVTNYECYKGLYSALNSMNLFEIVHSLLRQFGPEQWTLYKGKHLLSFCDNHDVTRVASILQRKEHLPLIYGLVFGMPGIPSIYYGSEWGLEGRKEEGDAALRPTIQSPEWNGLTDQIAAMVKARKETKALAYGDFQNLLLTNRQCVFARNFEGERILIAVNADDQEFMAHFDAGGGHAIDLLTGEDHDFSGGSMLAPMSVHFWKLC